MKKRFIVLSSLITILLASFPVVLFADETAQDSSNLHTLSDGVLLDQYFYDNYDLLPYLESDGTQYINTDIVATSDLKISLTLSDIQYKSTSAYFFGSYKSSDDLNLGIQYQYLYDRALVWFYRGSYNFPIVNIPYNLNTFTIDRNDVYLNNNLLHTFNDNSFTASKIFIFTRGFNNGADNNMLIGYKLYKFSIYDYSLNDGDGGYVRYYYPAKAKVSGTLGLYDAVNKTFVTTGSSTPFVNPTDSQVIDFQIGNFVTSGLGWIDDIFDFVIATPIILFFFAIALAGSIYRWARRVVHF